MSRFKKFRSAVCAALCLTGVNTVQAALFDRGGGLIYDDDLNITWLANANVNGRMTWDAANTWASSLNISRFVGESLTGWRLPTTDTPCFALNCTGSEMGHLFYNELGGAAGSSILTTHNSNLKLFQNFQSGPANGAYWSGTEYPPYVEGDGAWYFDFNVGSQDPSLKVSNLYALAARPGDVAPIPEPETYAMLLAGLGVLGLAARRRKLKVAAT